MIQFQYALRYILPEGIEFPASEKWRLEPFNQSFVFSDVERQRLSLAIRGFPPGTRLAVVKRQVTFGEWEENRTTRTMNSKGMVRK